MTPPSSSPEHERLSEVDVMRTYDLDKRNATVIETPGDERNLVVDIDGHHGSNDGASAKQEEMFADMRAAEGEFDVIITHPHSDHASAGRALLEDEDIEIRRLFIGGEDKELQVPPIESQYTSEFDDLNATVKIEAEELDEDLEVGKYSVANEVYKKGIRPLDMASRETIGVKAGDGITLDGDGNRMAVALWPPRDTEEVTASVDDTNNMGTVVKYHRDDTGTDVLFAGDIEAETEGDLTELYDEELSADVLVLPHHGAKSSGTREFLEAVDPDEIIVPARANPRNDVGESQKPDLETLKRIHETNPEATIRWTGAEGRALHGIDDGVSGSSERPLREDRTNGGLSPADALAIRYAQELRHAAGSSDSKPTPDELIEEGVLANVPWEEHAETELPRPPECLRESEFVHAETIEAAERPDQSPVEDHEPRHQRPR